MSSKQRSALALTLMGTLALGLASPALAKGVPEDKSTARLEQGFWYCDNLAATERLDLQTAACCSVVTEALKQRKFGGDFQAMLDWWAEEKPRARQRRWSMVAC